MSLNVGTLSAILDLDDGPFSRKLDQSGSKFSGVVKAAGVAAVAVGTALAGGAVVSVNAFVDFQKQMNEVFTLLPGISQQAMGDMTSQVEDFSTKFGVLPKEVVPALYQSLSAGVPPGNVFDFLETAQKAAMGGVTDLTTAVNGISSVVNAYGSDVLSAGQASDLMFTAVKMGKTTFGELSASLFNVTPAAAALGVQFGDITAAMSAMTAQGIPTSVASTNLRQMLVELSKSGQIAADNFEHLAGVSFRDFIANGGNVQQALQLMERAAGDSGKGINDLFGSVEAGQAALALTGKGTETFSRNLDAMANSAGATEGAYQQMATGIAFWFDRMKAIAAVAMLKIGDIVTTGIKAFVDAFSGGRVTADGWIGAIQRIAVAAHDFIDTVGPPLQSMFQWMRDNLPVVAAGILGLLVPAFVAWAVTAATAAAASIAAAMPFIALSVAIAALAAGLVYAYENFDGFRAVVDTVASFLRDTAWPIFQTVFGDIIAVNEAVYGAVADKWPTIQSTIESVFGAIQTAWDTVLHPVLDAVLTALSDVVQFVVDHWNEISDTAATVWAAVRAVWDTVGAPYFAAVRAVTDEVVGFVIDRINQVVGVWQGVWDALQAAWDQVGAPLFDAVKTNISLQVEAVKLVIQGLVDAWSTAWGWIEAAWNNIGAPIFETIKQVIGTIRDWAIDAKNAIQSMVDVGKSAVGIAVDPLGGLRSKILGFASGGLVPGPVGKPLLAVVHGGEFVVPASLGHVAAMMPPMPTGHAVAPIVHVEVGSPVVQVMTRDPDTQVRVVPGASQRAAQTIGRAS